MRSVEHFCALTLSFSLVHNYLQKNMPVKILGMFKIYIAEKQGFKR